MDSFYASICPQYYRTSGAYQIYLVHCKLPTISEEDKTIIAATVLVRELNHTVPVSAAIKVKHAAVLQKLTAIINNQPAPRVGDSAIARVGQPSLSNTSHKQADRPHHPFRAPTQDESQYTHRSRQRRSNSLKHNYPTAHPTKT